MRYLRNFLIAMVFIFTSVALMNAALASHTRITSGVWIVVIDWDAEGNPSIPDDFKPVRVNSMRDCAYAGNVVFSVLQQREPDRRFVVSCAMPDDIDDLDAIIDLIIEEYRPAFTPGQGV